MYDVDATEPTEVGPYTVRVLYDPEPSPPWDWDWGATALYENGWNPATNSNALGRHWRDFHASVEDAVRAGWDDVLAVETVGLGRSYDIYTVFVTADDVKMTGAPDAGRLLRDNIESLRQYVEGEVYGYVVERNGETIESCWGFYGDTDYVMSEAESIAEALVTEDAKVQPGCAAAPFLSTFTGAEA